MKFIYQIEICSFCNRKCPYCPHPYSKRELGFMTEETLMRSLELVKTLKQDWVCLNNFGEPLLHPMLFSFISRVKQCVPYIALSTNGVLLTRETAVKLAENGLTELFISNHDASVAQQAAENCKDLGILKRIRTAFNHDWAGTASRHPELYNEKDTLNINGCNFFIGRESVVVLWDGRITSCCIDMEGRGIIGSVYDANPLQLKPEVFSLCSQCNISWVNRTEGFGITKTSRFSPI